MFSSYLELRTINKSKNPAILTLKTSSMSFINSVALLKKLLALIPSLMPQSTLCLPSYRSLQVCTVRSYSYTVDYATYSCGDQLLQQQKYPRTMKLPEAGVDLTHLSIAI
jgi:hypothetical protein